MRIYLFFFFVIVSLNSFSQTLAQKIQKAYDLFSKDKQLLYGISSLTVLNAQTGEVVFSENSNTGLPPASTLKIVTSITAYNLLGKDFTWQTGLTYSGIINADGTLEGNLILVGGGDPTLGSERYRQSNPKILFDRWLLAIKKAGIKRINGSVIADDRLFGTQSLPLGWIWQDIGNYYGAGTSSLSWGENQFGLVFSPGAKAGEPTVLVRTEPSMNYLKIVNEVTTGVAGSGDNVYVFSAPYSAVVYLRGTYGIDLKKTIFASVPDPAFEAVYRLSDTLKRAGISISAEPSTFRLLELANKTLPVSPKIIDTYNSPSLENVIYWFNQKSLNLYGEQMLKTLGQKKVGSISGGGTDIVTNYWSNKLGIDPNSLKVLDGSGLSPETRVTTLTMARILQSAKKETWYDSFYQSLPSYNNMKMKSGSIKEVLAYAGYEYSVSGTPLVFSIIASNYSGSTSDIRQKMFRLLDSLK